MHSNDVLPRELFVFDIETVPDTDLVDVLLRKKFSTVQEKRKALEEYHLDITGGKNAFPRQPFHKIVAISFLRAKITTSNDKEAYEFIELRSGGEVNSTEEELVAGFLQYCSKIFPRLISFNGRGFDVPVLRYRAMKYDISASWFYYSGNKWENYLARYNPDWHCDLLEVFSDYGASARCSLNEISTLFGLPGKFGLDGSKVVDYYDGGRIEEIRDYCEADVVNTYIIYLKYAVHSGRIDTSIYESCLANLKEYLKNSKKPAHNNFLKEWRK